MPEYVDCIILQMAAFDQDRLRAQIGDAFGCVAHGREIADCNTGKFRRFVEVRCNQVCPRDQQTPESGARIAIEQRGAVFAERHGVDDQRATEGAGCDGFDNRRTAQCAGLDGMRREVFEDGVELLADQIGVEHFHARCADGVLNRDQGDDRRAEDAEFVEGLEIGLKACAAAWIGTGDGEGDARHSFPSA